MLLKNLRECPLNILRRGYGDGDSGGNLTTFCRRRK